ncbi:hypothetical protein [Streptomyces atroolivaceus]|uniref:Uncharacterized protein n=2 Tax=Streptomyces atroolivaceus TaxID=66869 RepID=A0ABV9V032_STRAZ|nr:hypothetical protein [Streptomyces atroolivaceus]
MLTSFLFAFAGVTALVVLARGGFESTDRQNEGYGPPWEGAPGHGYPQGGAPGYGYPQPGHGYPRGGGNPPPPASPPPGW